MRYFITKIRNGTWRLEWENGSYSEHSTKDGAERMVLQVLGLEPFSVIPKGKNL